MLLVILDRHVLLVLALTTSPMLLHLPAAYVQLSVLNATLATIVQSVQAVLLDT